MYTTKWFRNEIDPLGGFVVNDTKDLEKTIERTFKDPIAVILLKNSNLTKTQYESLIINYITDYLTDKELNYQNKALLRSKKVSRGSFSRSLGQARANIISAIYTVLLLMYVGIFETEPFDEYRILSEKLSEYLKIIQTADDRFSAQLLQRIENELLEGINSLSETRNLKNL